VDLLIVKFIVLSSDGSWIKVPPIEGTLVVNFGNAFEAATEGAVRATVHRVKAPTKKDRYSIPFFMGLPLDLTVSEMRSYIPAEVRSLRRDKDGQKAVDESAVASFLDPRWDSLGESQLRKWIRSHEDVGRIWYGDKVCKYYLQ
jgi:isopenicillin N synthase-like dioxygenase